MAAVPVLTRRRSLVGGAAGVVLVGSLGAGAGVATAAPGDPTVALTPTEVVLTVLPAENLAGIEVTDPLSSSTDALLPVGISPGSAIEVDLPEPLRASSSAPVRLSVLPSASAPEGTEPLVFSTGSTDPATQLGVTPTPEGLSITVPAPDALGTGLHGPDVRLDVDGLELPADAPAGLQLLDSATPELPELSDLSYFLELQPEPLPVVDLSPSLFAVSAVPGTTVAAGGSLDLTLPTGSSLSYLGLDSLVDGVFVLQDVGDDDLPTGAAPLVPTATTSADGRTASLAVPAEAPVGSYALGAVLTTQDGLVISLSAAELEVTAAPTTAAPVVATPAPTATPAPRQNPGLRSNTGWEEPATASHAVAPLAGAACLLLAGGVGASAARSARSAPRAAGRS